MNEELNQNLPVSEDTTNEAPAAENTAADETTVQNVPAEETVSAPAETAAEAAPIPRQNTNPQNGSYPAGGTAQQNIRYNPYTGQPYTTQSTQSAAPVKAKKEKKPRKPLAFIKKLAAVVALALVFGSVSGAVILGMNHEFLLASGAQNSGAPTQSEAVPGSTLQERTPGSEQIQSASAAMKEALEKAALAEQGKLTIPQINIIMKPAMVSINVTGETEVQTFFGTSRYPFSGSGSGIIVGINETELLIATNNHVIDDADNISVQFVNDTSLEAFTKGTDAKNDLAIIAIPLSTIPEETAAAIAIAELGDSDALVIGEEVVAVGNALGFGQSVTNGIVSALNRAVKDSNGNTAYMIQTNAAINPGNSGGALVNMQGQVIGINSAKYSDESVEGMCFAIPINTALPILEELMARTTRTVVAAENSAYLGIYPQDITSAMTQNYGWPQGVYVSEVTKGSAADKGGMMKGDIITAFDGETVTTTAAFRKLLTYYEAGETIKIVVQRMEQGTFNPVELTITLDHAPEQPAAEENNTAGAGGQNDSGNAGGSTQIPDWWDNFFGGRSN